MERGGNPKQKMQFTVKGQSFDSPHSHQEAVEIISKLASDFARSLTAQYRRKGNLSPRQWPWVHKLAVDATAPKAEKVSVEIDCSEIVSLFDFATEKGMKRPRITFPEAKFSLSRDGFSVHVSKGAYPGKYFGKITREGEFIPGRNFSDLDIAFLESFSKSPREYATSSGVETGSCRFCNLTLSTPESVSVGYGPVCASHWGLSWGKVSR
jgi:hypothetical protein